VRTSIFKYFADKRVEVSWICADVFYERFLITFTYILYMLFVVPQTAHNYSIKHTISLLNSSSVVFRILRSMYWYCLLLALIFYLKL